VCDENEIMLVFDEIQCGCGITGKMWTHEGFGVQPDLMAFGKKMQVCGIMSNNRVDEVEKNCFVESSRINSTWGSNITDMARSTRILQVIKEDNLLDNADRMGRVLLKVLHGIEEDFPTVSKVRGSGLMCAFDLPDGKRRDDFRKIAFEENMLILGCGTKSIRFRPILCVEEERINEMNERARKVLKKI
jgi:L-lysine 6-transaminase